MRLRTLSGGCRHFCRYLRSFLKSSTLSKLASYGWVLEYSLLYLIECR
jgi:hypothetical protein